MTRSPDPSTEARGRTNWYVAENRRLRAERDALAARFSQVIKERDLYKQQLDAVDFQMPMEAHPLSKTGVVGRVQAILNLQSDRARLSQAEEVIEAAQKLAGANATRARGARFWTLNEREALAVLRDSLDALAASSAGEQT